jgi:hypothetical protein
MYYYNISGKNIYGGETMKEKKIPVPEPQPDEYELPSASYGDMTGLIPTPAEDENQRDSYGDIIPYLGDGMK